MKIVAFLQNMWVRDPERVKAGLRAMPEHLREKARLRMMHYALFAGCLTGRRLRAAFGKTLCDLILWEETTREIAGDPKTIFPAQPEHIRVVLERERPDVVLAFGKISANACFQVLQGLTFDGSENLNIKLITAPHPAARQADTPAKLKAVLVELEKAIL